MPYSLSTLASQRKGPLIVGNYKRVVEVWLEEPYRSYFYARQPLAHLYPAGNLSVQLGLKSALHCASFDWFISKHGNAIFKSFPRLPANQFWGHLRSVTLNQTCLHSPGKNPPAKLGLYPCVKQKNWQLFRLNIRGQLGYGERCILGSTGEVNLHKCKTGTVDGPWTYENDSKQMRYSGQLCLTVRGSSAVALDLCHDPVAGDQQWTWQPIQPLDL